MWVRTRRGTGDVTTSESMNSLQAECLTANSSSTESKTSKRSVPTLSDGAGSTSPTTSTKSSSRISSRNVGSSPASTTPSGGVSARSPAPRSEPGRLSGGTASISAVSGGSSRTERTSGKPPSSLSTTSSLSERQQWIRLNVLLPIAEGWTPREVSARLLISRREVCYLLDEHLGHLIETPLVKRLS